MSQISDCFPLLPELNDIHIIFRLLGVEVLETVLTGQKRRGDEVQCLSPLSSCLSLSEGSVPIQDLGQAGEVYYIEYGASLKS